ncbi:TIGR02646 family protein [Myxococcota bacterium]|nr:TIGR02646 family protein [Myxococcota bacterium]
MRSVRKSDAPHCLAGVKREARRVVTETEKPLVPEDWALLKDCAETVREALARDQDGLCAYCGVRLIRSGGANAMTIEHHTPRSVDVSQMFEWSNLLGVCSGRTTHNGRQIQHCDKSRAPKRPLSFHPVDDALRIPNEFQVHLRGSSSKGRLGSIVTQSPEANSDVAELNLNAELLIENRAEVINRLRGQLSKDGSEAHMRRLYRTFTTPTAEGLPSYAHVAEAYLRRKLRERGLRP